GVDVEKIQADLAVGALVADHFTPGEREYLMNSPEATGASLFFTLWTRKEACAKALGSALSAPLTRFDVQDPRGVLPLELTDVAIDADHRAAVCVVPPSFLKKS